MFGSDYAKQFGLPGFPWMGIDPQGGMFQPPFSGMENGQPVPGVPAPAASGDAAGGPGLAFGSDPAVSANPSVDALRSANPLAQFTQFDRRGGRDYSALLSGAGSLPGGFDPTTGSPLLGNVGAPDLGGRGFGGAGAPPRPGPGS